MILRLLTNIVRWSWGLPSYDFVEKMKKDDLAFLMVFGGIIDAIALAGLVALIIELIKRRS